MTLQEIIDQLESCHFECEVRPQQLNVTFIDLKKMAGISDGMPKRKTAIKPAFL